MKKLSSGRAEIRICNDCCPREMREKYENDLVVALARFGYSPYLMSDDEGVAFTVDMEESVVPIADGMKE